MKFSPLRDWINGYAGPAEYEKWQWGASYKDDTWISSAARGNTVTPLEIIANSTTLSLRINSVRFLCRTLVAPTVGKNADGCGATGKSIVDSGYWVSNTDGREAKPNRLGSMCMLPAQTLQKVRYDKIEIASDTTGGGVLSFIPFALPHESRWSREEDSRYWFSDPYYFKYISTAGFKTSGTLTFRVYYRVISGYHSNDEYYQVQNCVPPSGKGVISRQASTSLTNPKTYLKYEDCYQFNDTWSVDITVKSYELDPSTSVTTGAVVLPGQPIGVTTKVAKTGNITSGMTKEDGNPGTSWWVDRMVYAPGSSYTPPANDVDNGDVPCATSGFSGYISCTKIADHYQADGNLATETDYSYTETDVVPVYPVGTRVCYVTSVSKPAASATPVWRHSAPTCTLVAAAPYAVVAGGNVWAGGSATPPYAGMARIRGVAGNTFGSFGDYGVFATRQIDNFGSAGMLGRPYTASGMASGQLTFANAPQLGTFTTTHQLDNLVAQYASSLHTPAVVNGSGQVAASGVYVTAGNLTINASTMSPGVRAVIYAPTGTVTIAGNIAYQTNGVTRFSDLPSLTVVARDIRINGSVTRVDGNFYASNRFVSCNEGPIAPGASAAITTTGACSQQLVVNGAVAVANQAANSLVLNRSFGGAVPSQPAELIRMRPEVFLTPYEASSISSSSVINTVQETELPLRY